MVRRLNQSKADPAEQFNHVGIIFSTLKLYDNNKPSGGASSDSKQARKPGTLRNFNGDPLA